MVKGKALLFGLNYAHIPDARLNGCINDVMQISNQIHLIFGDYFPIDIFTDDVDKVNTSYDGIVKHLYNLAIQTYSDDLEFAWVHFSGHGSQTQDTNGDELDYMDEGICPSDFNKKGIIIDDILNNVISKCNPKTKILFVSDCCHSGSILDLKYTWSTNIRKCKTENKNCKVKSNVIMISGCMDNQTSADAYNLLNNKQHIGALTASFIKVLEKKPQQLYDVFSFISSVQKELKIGGFNQYPCLSSTYDISREPNMIPFQMQQPQQQQQTRQVHFQETKQNSQRSLPSTYPYRPPSYYETPNTCQYPPRYENMYVTFIPVYPVQQIHYF
jgi:hypothetical protein